MNNLQKRFCQEYLIDLNGSAAAVRAGYSKKTSCQKAYELLNKPDVREEIQKEMKNMAEKIGLSVETVLTDIDIIKKDAMALNDKNRIIDRKAALKACELEGRHLKMFTDRLDIQAKITHDETIEDLA